MILSSQKVCQNINELAATVLLHTQDIRSRFILEYSLSAIRRSSRTIHFKHNIFESQISTADQCIVALHYFHTFGFILHNYNGHY